MSDKLSDKFLESFAKRASSLFESRNVSAKSEVESLQEQIQVVDRKINAARIGGAGHLGKLVEQKSLLQFQLQGAKANAPVEVELDEAAQPKWKVQIGKKHYTVTARNTAEANTKAKKLAAKDGNNGVGGKIERMAEEVELEEQKTPYIVVDTADDNKVVGMASDERNAKMTISSAERPPMSIKDKSTLKIVKSNKKQNIGMPLKEDTEIAELHTSLLEAHGIEKKVAEKVKKVFDGMSDAEKAAFMKSYLKNPKAAMDYMFADMKKMAKEEIEEALDPVNPKAVKKKFDDRKDKDLDNDGDTDSSDEYLHKRRKAISKALAKEEVEVKEAMSAKERALAKAADEAKSKDKVSLKKAPWDMKKEEVELEEGAQPKMKGDYARVVYNYREDYYNITVYKNGKEVANDDGYFGANETGNPLIKKFTDLVKKARLRPEGLPIVDEAGKKGVFKGNAFKWNVAEAKNDYTINHKTFSSAVQHAKSQVEKQGYSIDDDEWDRKVAMGPRRPGRGKTNRYTIELMKDGKPTKRMLQMQVYYDEGRYELNMYVS